MKRRGLLRLGIVFMAVLLLLVACRREQESLPTPLPTAAPPSGDDVSAGDAGQSPDDSTPAPTATALVKPEPTDVVDPELIDWPPQVVYTSPEPGEEVLLDGAVTVRFDQPMDRASVEAAFSVQASSGDGAFVSGEFVWPSADTLVFTPQSKLNRQQTYRLNIGRQAASIKGFQLNEPLDIYLKTVGFFRVSQTIPADGLGDVSVNSAITVLFNRPVVPLASGGQQADLPQPLIIQPPVDGRGEWVSTSIYRFLPDQPLAAATLYTARVATGFTDITGSLPEEEFTWQFTTVSPEVVAIQPENGTTGFDPSRPMTITFNMPMDRTRTEAATSVRTPDAPPVRLEYTWSEGDRVLMLKPRQRLTLGAPYQIGIAQAASAANGQAPMMGDVLSGFTTVGFPAVVNTRPGQGEVAERWQRGFSIDFASPMDWTTLEGRIEIKPDPGKVTYFFYDTQLSADFQLERNTEYVVTIPGEATDPYGNPLGRDYTWRFSTPASDPIASLNLPQQISQVSTSFATEIDIIHRNVSRLDVALYELGLPLNLIIEPYSVSDYRPAINPLRTWSFSPETPPEQADVLSLPLADGGSLPTGVYLLSVAAPETTGNERFWQNQRLTLVVADTNVVVKEMFGETRVWVTDLASGRPASGRNLVAYNDSGALVGTAVSDSNGLAWIETPVEDYLPGITVVSNRPGEAGFGIGQSRWDDGVSPWQFGLNARTDAQSPVFAYIYTDRPIYRPGDTIHYKGIVRNADYGRYRLPSLESVELNLSAASYFIEDSLEETFTVTLDESGTFSGDYVLPDSVTLGSYQFSLSGDDFFANRRFSVAEYRKPEFLITMTPQPAEILRGREATVDLEARYFFGGPATDLAVTWSIYEEYFSPDVSGPFYFFGDGGNFYYEEFPFFGGGTSLGNYVTGGEGVTDGDGRLTITLPADLLNEVEAGSRKVNVEATVSDLANFPVTSRTSIIMHAAETYVGIAPSNFIASSGKTAEFDLLTVDWEGQAAADQPVEIIFYQREWQRERGADFGEYVTRWKPVDTEVDRQQVTTNRQGKAVAEFVPSSGGTYLAVAMVSDRGGRTHTSSAVIWVSDSRYRGWRSDPKERRMDLVLDKRDYRPGETARLLVQSPFADPVQAWLTIERGTLIEQRVITLQGSSDVLEIPIDSQFAPNVFVTITAVKGVTPDDADNPYADIRLGMTEIVVSPEQLALDLSLEPRDELFMPGDKAVYDVVVRDYRGNPVQAELSLALVDLAVLTLKEDNAPHILDAFYGRQPYRSRLGSGLFKSGEGLEIEIPVEVLGRGGGGGGGVAEETALSQAAGEEKGEEIRRDFPDTAYWQAKVTTDADGRATVEIPLPDSLTTWRLMGKVVSSPGRGDTLVGQSAVDVVVTLPLLLRPVTPRFFTVGDTMQLGAMVNNNTDQAIAAAVSLEADGLTLHAAAEQTVNVPAGGRQLVQWQVLVDDVEHANLTFRVSGGGFRDATKPKFGVGPDKLIPVYRFDARDIVGTSGVLPEAGRRVEAILLPPGVDERQGQVAVNLSPSLAAALIEALTFNNDQEYLPACAHAITDRLLPNVATARAIQDLSLPDEQLGAQLRDLIPHEIDQLQGLVKSDGGWGWCYSQESNAWITAYGLLALNLADEAGYSVDAEVVNVASRFLLGQLRDPGELSESYEVNRQAFLLYALAESGLDVRGNLNALFDAHRALLDPYARAFMALAYQLSGDGGNRLQALLGELNGDVILSAAGAHWEDESLDHRNMNSDVRGTAIVVDALIRIDPENGLLPQAVRWLMSARQAQRWATGHDTAWSILALTDWMAATGELGADYEYVLGVNMTPLLEGSFTSDNITASEQALLPISRLDTDTVNFIDIQRGLGNGRLYYTVYLDASIDVAAVSAANRGISVQRAYYDAACDPVAAECLPIEQIVAGQRVRVELTIIAQHDLFYAVIEDPIPSGAEAIDPGLETSAVGLGGGSERTDLDYRYGYWGWWYFNRIEYRDEKVVFLSEFLPAGTYQYTYYLQTNIAGEYQVMPATAREEFFPEVFGRSEGLLFTIFQ